MQKFEESHAWRFVKNGDGVVQLQILTRKDFIDGKRMHVVDDWSAPILVLKENAAGPAALKADLLRGFRELQPCGFRSVGDSEGWEKATESKNQVLSYARRHQDTFSAAAVTELTNYYGNVPLTATAFTRQLDVARERECLAPLIAYCAGRGVREDRRAAQGAAISALRTTMAISTAGTVANVTHSGFTARDRRQAVLREQSEAEYTTTEAVRKNEYVFAKVQHSPADALHYELPLSFGRVVGITPAASESDSSSSEDDSDDGSTNPDDVLLVEWYQPMTKVPHQKYGPGYWELKAAESASADPCYTTSIPRGSIVLAGIKSGGLVAQQKSNGRTIKCKLSAGLKRKIMQLSDAVSLWSKYGDPNIV